MWAAGYGTKTSRKASASGSASHLPKTCLGLSCRTASSNRGFYGRSTLWKPHVVLLRACHIGRGNKATGWRQNCWGRNSRQMCVSVRGLRRWKIEEEAVSFGACLCPGEQLTDGKERGSWESLLVGFCKQEPACKVPVRTNDTGQAMLGHFRDPALMVMQRISGWHWSRVSP